MRKKLFGIAAVLGLVGASPAMAQIPIEIEPYVGVYIPFADLIDQAQGAGAAETLRKVTVNIGVIKGGLKVNMIPGACALEVDIRIPIGLAKESVMTEVQKIVARHPEVSCQEINYTPPSWCDPYGKMVGYIQQNVKVMPRFSSRQVRTRKITC